MSQTFINYGTSAALTCTLAGLVYTAGRESAAIVSTGSYCDYMMAFKFKTATGTHSGDWVVYVYLAPSEDGTNYATPATGTDAAITITTASNQLLPLVFIPFGTSATGLATQYAVVPSVAAVCGGNVPRSFTVAIQNNCATLSATAADCSITYTPIFITAT